MRENSVEDVPGIFSYICLEAQLFSHTSSGMLARRTFVTGQPGSGKTTLVSRVAEALMARGVRCRGFYTEETLKGGKRIGFDVVAIPDGRRGVLARKDGNCKGLPRVGTYSVDVKAFERVALPTLRPLGGAGDKTELIICDEIGRMELKSDKFKAAMRALLDSGAPIFGALTATRYGHKVPFCEYVKGLDDVAVHNIKKGNRDRVHEELESLAIQEYSAAADASSCTTAPKSKGKQLVKAPRSDRKRTRSAAPGRKKTRRRTAQGAAFDAQ